MLSWSLCFGSTGTGGRPSAPGITNAKRSRTINGIALQRLRGATPTGSVQKSLALYRLAELGLEESHRTDRSQCLENPSREGGTPFLSIERLAHIHAEPRHLSVRNMYPPRAISAAHRFAVTLITENTADHRPWRRSSHRKLSSSPPRKNGALRRTSLSKCDTSWRNADKDHRPIRGLPDA
jgi:hypothetical protein